MCAASASTPPPPPHPTSRMATHLRDELVMLCHEKPKAVLVASAHWETRGGPTVNTSAAPPLLFDYYGFPPETYELTWEAPGDPALASRVKRLLDDAGFSTNRDEARGFDHGVFCPLKLSFPNANVPVVQLSLVEGLDPETHLAMGRALAPLRREGILIIGSGMSYHNMGGFLTSDDAPKEASKEFDAWLTETCSRLAPGQRAERLRNWTGAPSARICHPREEHLIPLMVAVGAAEGEEGRRVYSDAVMGCAVSGFAFGGRGGGTC